MTAPIPTEEAEQRALIQWADRTRLPRGCGSAFTVGHYLLAVANGGARHKAEGGKLKAQGVRPGVPDLLFALPQRGRMAYAGLWIELKRQKGGSVSPSQREWHERLTQAGYAVVVARGWEEAVQQIRDYLEGCRA